MQCTVAKGQTWQELGECLSKRVDVVVCKPEFLEMGNRTSSATAGQTSATTGQTSAVSGQTSAVSGTRSPSGQVSSPSTGAGSRYDVVNVSGSKMGVAVFVILAAGSFAGMML